MPTPTDGEHVRRLLGFTNYLAKFLPNLSAISEPLRRLIQKDADFEWGSSQQQAFEMIKEIATAERSLAYYDVNKPVVVQCDASTLGLGATLMQDGRPVAYASISLTKCEQNYAPIELECLAIALACRKCDQFIYGHPSVVIHSDHLPLQSIFKKSMLEAPTRLPRMPLAVQRYDIKVVYKPGREQLVADMLSRVPSERKRLTEMTDLSNCNRRYHRGGSRCSRPSGIREHRRAENSANQTSDQKSETTIKACTEQFARYVSQSEFLRIYIY